MPPVGAIAQHRDILKARVPQDHGRLRGTPVGLANQNDRTLVRRDFVDAIGQFRQRNVDRIGQMPRRGVKFIATAYVDKGDGFALRQTVSQRVNLDPSDVLGLRPAQ
jgi:hypothetical protein